METARKDPRDLGAFENQVRSPGPALPAHEPMRADFALPRPLRSRAGGGSPLSGREMEVVELVAQGYGNREIAEKMFVTAHTVRNHVHGILNKLHLSDRSEIALWRVGSVQGEALQENRQHPRFDISLRVRYRPLDGSNGNSGAGQALNISTSGIWFTTEAQISLGLWLKLSMDWPVLLNGACRLQLAIDGHVIRSEERGAALAIKHFDFHTRSA